MTHLTERFSPAQILVPLCAFALVVVGWWGLTGPVGVPRYLLPSPSAVASQVTSNADLYVRNAGHTVWKILVGCGTGATAGFVLAVTVFYRPLLRRSLLPYLVTLRVLPTIAVAPLLLIYVGVGTTAVVVFVSLIVFFPMVVNTVAGLERASEREMDLLRSVSADGFVASLSVRLPYALPDVFSGLKQAVTLAVVGAIVAEWVVGSNGLGYLILVASENVQPAVMITALVALEILGLALYAVVVAVQRSIPWLDEL